jgi:hypothetical protein
MFPTEFKYATQVWLTSVLIAPFLFFIIPVGTVGTGDFSLKGALSYWGLLVMFGGLLSIPSWLALMFFVKMINRMDKSIFNKKLIIQGLCIVLGIVPFFAFFGFRNAADLAISIPYIITLSVGLWYFPLKKRKEEDIMEQLMN